MPTRQVESTHEAEPNHPVADKGAAGVESPTGEQMQGANGPARQDAPDAVTAPLRDTNADDTDPGAGDQDIDTAGTEADEQSVAHDALGLPSSDPASPARIV